MDQKIEIVLKEFGWVLEIEERVSVMKMPKIMGEDFKSIAEYSEIKNLGMRGAPYAKYVDVDWEKQLGKGFFSNLIDMFSKKWHFYCGIEIEKELEENEKYLFNKVPKRKYIKTTHYGAYYKVGKTYRNMYNWAKENNYILEEESFEMYMNDPRNVKQEELETVVYIPIKI